MVYVSECKDITDSQYVSACNMNSEETLLGDTYALGQHDAHFGMIAPQLKNIEGLLSNKVVSGKAYTAQTLDHSFCWKEIPWLKSVTKLRILKKGILTSEDAMKAIEAGVAGIIVSYHGARQLDYTPATISVLEESCSRGMACNFIHCFRNPRGDYEWADLDKPPPRYCLTKMAALFWYADESVYDRQLERKKSERMLNSYKMLTVDSNRPIF